MNFTDCNRSGVGTTRCDGHEAWEDRVRTSSFALVTNGMMVKWDGRMPMGWFTYVGTDSVKTISKLFDLLYLPVVGDVATVVWIALKEVKVNKNYVVKLVKQIVKKILNRNHGSTIYFVMHVPLLGPQELPVINFNKNLLYALRWLRRSNKVQCKAIALHHWCLRQGKKWNSVNEITKQEVYMLVFLIVLQVDKSEGLAG